MDAARLDEGVSLVSRYLSGLSQRRAHNVGSSEMHLDQYEYEGDGYHDEYEGDGYHDEYEGDGYDDEDDEDYELEEEHIDQDTEEIANPAPLGRKFRSKAWREYLPVLHVNGEVTAGQCKHCNKVISAKRGHGTSGLRHHLQRCKDRAAVIGTLTHLNATLMTPDGVSAGMWRWDPDVSRKELVRMVVLHELPFSIVEYDGFQKFVSSLNPSFNMITRRTLKNDCMKAFDEQRSALKEIFSSCKSRISLTMDMWTSNQTIGYMVITAHFIDDSWMMDKKIIKFNTLETPHSGITMFNVALKCIRDLNFEDKLFAITLDNASNNGRMVQMLKENLLAKNMLVGQGKLLHQRCAAHILNLVCQAGLTFLDPIIDNIRESVKFVRANPSRKEKFAEIVAQQGIISEKSLCLDVSTRWNSTFNMTTTAFPFRTAFDALEMQDPQYMYNPSAEEWELAKKVCTLLKVFFDATNVVSGTKYPTANLYFQQMWQAKEALDKEASQENSPFAAMLAPMQKKLKKYWKVSWLALSLPVILDPRFKFIYLEFRFPQIFDNGAANKLTKVKRMFEVLFQQYAQSNLPDSTQQRGQVMDMVIDSSDPLSDWDQHLSLRTSSTTVVCSELDTYLSKTPLARTDKFDILAWWKTNSAEYPILSSMARDLLAVPASTVASESAFSTGRRVISDFRSRLVPDTVEALICLQDSYRKSCTTKLSTASVYDLLGEEGLSI